MKISILTPSYNQGRFIEKNILSVLNQDYDNFEHIIIDGGSTDETLSILKKYPHLRWISEKDEGQADALNKGLAMSTGDIIGWANSDDFYEKNIFSKVVKYFSYKHIKWIVGNLVYSFPDNNLNYVVNSPRISYQDLLRNPDIVKQQPTFFRKDIIEQVEGWDNSLYMAMDYDLWIKLSKIAVPLKVNDTFAYFTHHVDQKTSYKNILTQIENLNRILNRENIPTHNRIWTLKRKVWYLIKSIVKINLIKLKILDKKYIIINYLKVKKSYD